MNLREALQSLYDEHGTLTPLMVVEEAKAEKTPAGVYLHGRLTWNDQVAGARYRIDEARDLIRSVKVVYREATPTEVARAIRGFVSVRDETGNVYRPSDEVAEDLFLRQMVLRDMERDWKALYRRYYQFSEFLDMVLNHLADAQG